MRADDVCGATQQSECKRVLSIIIPALNEAANLERHLPDLFRVCPDAEVIVVDGGSTDGTPEVVSRFPQAKLMFAPRCRARQMNAGAECASGETLLFLHADTTLPTDAPDALTEALGRPDVVGGRFDVRFDDSRRIFNVVATMMNVRSRLSGIFTGDQAIFVRRRLFEAMGGYADVPLMEDIDFTRRLKRRGRLACLRLHVTTSARKWEREGALRTIALMWMLRFLYFAGVSPARLHGWYYGRRANTRLNEWSPSESGNARQTNRRV